MRLPSYLVRSPSGIFHFRWMIPLAHRARLGRSVIKRSLGTFDPRKAQAQALMLAASYAAFFALHGDETMTKTLEELLASAMGQRRRQDYNISKSPDGVLSIQTDGSVDDHRRALEMLTVMNAAPPPPRVATPSQGAPPAISVKSPLLLSKGIENWEERLVRDEPKTKTLGVKMLSVNGFLKWKGDVLISELTNEDFADFTAHLFKTLVKSTVNNRLLFLGHFMKWAMTNNHYPRGENPAEGHVSFTKKEKEARAATHGWQAFTDAQVKQMLAPENVEKIRTEHTRWCLVMAAYTGARINELAQLMVEDFIILNGQKTMSIDCLDVEQSVKTPDSKRKLPIHPDLLELGLWERVERLTEAGEKQLFPELNFTQNGFGGAVVSNVGRYLRDLGIKARGKHKMGTHSFRNLVIQRMDDFDVPDMVSRIYVGHTINQDAHDIHYKNKGVERMKKKLDLRVVFEYLPAPEWDVRLIDLKVLLNPAPNR